MAMIYFGLTWLCARRRERRRRIRERGCCGRGGEAEASGEPEVGSPGENLGMGEWEQSDMEGNGEIRMRRRSRGVVGG
jgi:hypothetical protein